MADTGIPFITSIANDIYDRVDKLASTLQKFPAILSKISEGFQENLNKLNENIENMLEESRNNRDLTLEAFSDSMTTLSQRIKEMKDDNEKTFEDPEMKIMIEKLDDVTKKLSTKYWDINTMLIIHSIHWILDILKGKAKNISVPYSARRALQVPLPAGTKGSVTAERAEREREHLGSKESQDARAFSKGVRKKTHDDHMKDIERRRKLFGRY